MTKLPTPDTSANWKDWARDLVDALEQAPVEQVTDPTPLQLAYRDSTAKALPGAVVVMYDPALGVPVYSKDGAWYRLSDDTAV